jgi:aerobic-type carbon monoxide dehydrogenase small subunit (CoxS/CutS family)
MEAESMEAFRALADKLTGNDRELLMLTIPRRVCGFALCRFCGVHCDEWHLLSCTWHWVHNPLPDALFGDDSDWDRRGA